MTDTKTLAIRDLALEWARNNGIATRSGYVVVANGRPTGHLQFIPSPAVCYRGTYLVSLCGGVVQIADGLTPGVFGSVWRTVYLNNTLAVPELKEFTSVFNADQVIAWTIAGLMLVAGVAYLVLMWMSALGIH